MLGGGGVVVGGGRETDKQSYRCIFQVKSSQKTLIIPHRAIHMKLINLRTCKGTPKHLRLEQHRQVMLHKNLKCLYPNCLLLLNVFYVFSFIYLFSVCVCWGGGGGGEHFVVPKG